MNPETKHKGFTLIELLVVISIIGFLASMILVSTKTARQKAREAKIHTDAYNIGLQIELIRDSTGKTVGELTGNWYGAGDFNSTDPIKNQAFAVTSMDGQWQALGFRRTPTDPWGDPYLIDANEGEPGFDCGRQDVVISGGQNGIYESGPYVINYIPNPGQAYAIPGTDDYFFADTLFRCTNAVPPG